MEKINTDYKRRTWKIKVEQLQDARTSKRSLFTGKVKRLMGSFIRFTAFDFRLLYVSLKVS